jgi:hypothetical protein
MLHNVQHFYTIRYQKQYKNNNKKVNNRKPDTTAKNNTQQQSIVYPNPYSMLAPPLESTYSPSQGWRPRIFHDRPTGLRYCYVNPIQVSLWNKNNNNKLIGSLALYTLPPLSKRMIGSKKGSTITAATAAAYHCEKK